MVVVGLWEVEAGTRVLVQGMVAGVQFNQISLSLVTLDEHVASDRTRKSTIIFSMLNDAQVEII